jgi:hypothetical protein
VSTARHLNEGEVALSCYSRPHTPVIAYSTPVPDAWASCLEGACPFPPLGSVIPGSFFSRPCFSFWALSKGLMSRANFVGEQAGSTARLVSSTFREKKDSPSRVQGQTSFSDTRLAHRLAADSNTGPREPSNFSPLLLIRSSFAPAGRLFIGSWLADCMLPVRKPRAARGACRSGRRRGFL